MLGFLSLSVFSESNQRKTREERAQKALSSLDSLLTSTRKSNITFAPMILVKSFLRKICLSLCCGDIAESVCNAGGATVASDVKFPSQIFSPSPTAYDGI